MAITSKMWMKPPTLDDVTRPSIQRINRTTATV